ncbi:MAG: hypothetical protein HUU08_15335 [Candidatus Brocadia sp.]|nr:hypothetical protein [Candidatus Brocadia sp.]
MNNNDFFTIFIFPFKYERADKKDLEPDKIAHLLSNGNKDSKKGWVIEHYAIDSVDNYNEFYYFHPNVQKALFNKKRNTGMEFLKRTDFHKLTVQYYDTDNHLQTIETQVNEIDIHLFDNQIGLLTITTEKREDDKTTDFHALLKYNDMVRRVYPPHLGDINTCGLKQNEEKKGNIKNIQFINSLTCENTCKPKYDSRLLPVRISLCGDNNKLVGEDFEPINLKANEDKDIVFLSNIIKELLAPFDLKHTHNMSMDKGKIYYTPFIDDRMFIVSYYSDNDVSYKLKNRCCDGYEYEISDDWYRFIFVDGNYANIENDAMKYDLIRSHTYARWAKFGSLFGMSRYSFVLLCSTDAPSYLKQHMKSMYYQMAMIVLFQRAMLLKFAEDIDDLTLCFEVGKLSTDLKEKSDRLHGEFIKFINKYWFVEVTPQEQGIEIYNQWMGLLNLEKLYNEVQKEVSELAGYVENKIEAETNSRVAMITYVGFPVLILGLITGILQCDVCKIKDALSFKVIGIILSLGFLFVFFCPRFRRMVNCKMVSWLKDKVSLWCLQKDQ